MSLYNQTTSISLMMYKELLVIQLLLQHQPLYQESSGSLNIKMDKLITQQKLLNIVLNLMVANHLSMILSKMERDNLLSLDILDYNASAEMEKWKLTNAVTHVWLMILTWLDF